MKAEERKELETNSLADGVAHLYYRIKSGHVGNLRWLAVVVIVGLAAFLVWYILRENKRNSSFQWTELTRIQRTAGPSDLDEFAKTNRDATAAKVARLESARILLGQEGISNLAHRDRDKRNKGIENIEKAREELTKLAEEFKGDPTLQIAALSGAAEAELSLVGIPKEGVRTAAVRRKKAAGLYKKASTIIGEKTPAGEGFAKRAQKIEADAEAIRDVGQKLNTLLTPPPSFTIPTPGEGPKAPEGPIPTPTPPAAPKAPDSPVSPPKTEGPKAPDTPVTPPKTDGPKAPDTPVTPPKGTPETRRG